jgi:hypothetical protein
MGDAVCSKPQRGKRFVAEAVSRKRGFDLLPVAGKFLLEPAGGRA